MGGGRTFLESVTDQVHSKRYMQLRWLGWSWRHDWGSNRKPFRNAREIRLCLNAIWVDWPMPTVLGALSGAERSES